MKNLIRTSAITLIIVFAAITFIPYTLAANPSLDNHGYFNPATGTSISQNITVGAGATILVVWIIEDNTTADRLNSTPQYNGSNMTQAIATITNASVNSRMYAYYIANPTSGTHAVTYSFSSSTQNELVFESLLNSATSPEGTTSNAASTSTLTLTVTVSTANSWLLGVMKDDIGSQSAGASTTLRDTFGGVSGFDANAVVAAGSKSLVVNDSGAHMYGFALNVPPAAGAAAPETAPIFIYMSYSRPVSLS